MQTDSNYDEFATAYNGANDFGWTGLSIGAFSRL